MNDPLYIRHMLTRRRALFALMGTTAKALTAGGAAAAVTVFGPYFRRSGAAHPDTAPPRDTTANPSSERRAVDPYRLPRHVVPSRYELRLAPDLDAFTFHGAETVFVTVREPTDDILLNATELSIESVSIENDQGTALQGGVSYEENTERCRLRFDRMITPGLWRLRLSFNGTLNDKLHGFYRSRYKDDAGREHVLAATQFQPTSARRVFPCWDEPSFKAVFAMTLEIAPSLTAVSNGRLMSEEARDGKKVMRFADTIPMSTYLVAFIVGDLAATEPIDVGSTPLRVWTVPGKPHLADFGLDIASASLRFFEKYYGMAYPGEKLDLLAIPDFAAGAMENFGAVTFRETALLVDRNAATHAELERVADVVAHENAHMWFGDLVTMSWWNGIWLNEAFATFMEVMAVDAWKPEWQRWATFAASRAAAFTVDGLYSTRPVEFPVRAPEDAEAMFDVLTYEKGASVLRMFEQYLGPEVFQEGVRAYLRAHAYDNADTRDLWVALEQVAREPVQAMLEPWIFRPGYPLVTVTRSDEGRLLLRQERFTYLREAPDPDASDVPRNTLWSIPIHIREIGSEGVRQRQVLLEDVQREVVLDGETRMVVVNAQGHGFYRVQYGADLLEPLVEQASKELEAVERYNLINDGWALALAGIRSAPEYLGMAGRYRDERDRNVWTAIIESLHAINRVLSSEDRPGFESFVRSLVSPAFRELGWKSSADESQLTRQLRGDLLKILGMLGNDGRVQEQAIELYTGSVRASSSNLDPNVEAAVIMIAAYVGEAARYQEFITRFQQAGTPQEEQRYLHALAAFRPPGLIQETLQRTIDGSIRSQDAPFVVRSLLLSVHARESAWAFVKANWETMDRLYPASGLRRMVQGITGLATVELEQDVREFFAVRRIDLGGKTLAQYLEQLHVLVTFKNREQARIGEYLRSIDSLQD